MATQTKHTKIYCIVTFDDNDRFKFGIYNLTLKEAHNTLNKLNLKGTDVVHLVTRQEGDKLRDQYKVCQ